MHEVTRIGVVYPQTEYSSDPASIRDYAQTADGLGYSHIIAYDHVVGANPNRPGGWQGVYNSETPFMEPFLLFSYMATLTHRIGFAPGIIILPQRQTVLVAKQAATLDVLTGGRLRLGVGIGWNELEYEALNEDFHNRGRRVEEQVQVLRLLWTQPLVTFKGQWHSIPDVGLKPMPIQKPIPIWFGGQAELALERMARVADGWMTNYRTAADAKAAIETIERGLAQANRQRSSFSIEARISYGDGNPDTWHSAMQQWQMVGVDYFSVNTMGCGFTTPAEHMAALQHFAQAVGLR